MKRKDNPIKVKGCGCRYRLQITDTADDILHVYEHLCDTHKDVFILQRYNAELILTKMIESDDKAMKEMAKQMGKVVHKKRKIGLR